MSQPGIQQGEGTAVWIISPSHSTARTESIRAKVTWTKRPRVRGGLRAVNKRLSGRYEKLLDAAEANTVRLIGRPRL